MTNEQIAFNILTKHPDCLRDDVPLQELICDIADAIGGAAMAAEQHGRIAERDAIRNKD